MKALTFNIELLEPLLIANPVSGDENSAEGLNYIPGSVIRGMLVGEYTNGARGDLSDTKFRRLFFGDVRFLNAYIIVDNVRGLPMPRSWHREKDAEEHGPTLDLANREAPKTPLTRVSTPFVRIQPAQPRLEEEHDGQDDGGGRETPSVVSCDPLRQIGVHISQSSRLAAAAKDKDSVFRYDALATGQQFAGAILAESEDDLREFEKLLKRDSFKIGKSRSAGYGAVVFSDVTVTATWAEYTPMHAVDSSRVIVTLLSDAIAHDPDTGAYAASLAKLFGAQPSAVFSQTHVIGGFNSVWGLPIPQASAIQAGSVFVFENTQEIKSKLKVAGQLGIGERRIDGFGRIAVDWHTAPEVSITRDRESPPTQVELGQSSMEQQLAQQMADRIWRAQLDALLRDAIGRSTVANPPRNTQLSRMRTLAREALRQNNAALISDVVSDANRGDNNARAMKKHARAQFERARVSMSNQSRLLDWLRDLANDPSKVWGEINAGTPDRPEIGGATAVDPPALEYAVRLIDGVLRRAAKEDMNR